MEKLHSRLSKWMRAGHSGMEGAFPPLASPWNSSHSLSCFTSCLLHGGHNGCHALTVSGARRPAWPAYLIANLHSSPTRWTLSLIVKRRTAYTESLNESLEAPSSPWGPHCLCSSAQILATCPLECVAGWTKWWTAGRHFGVCSNETGEGNGSPLQCSCLENPRDGGAWWAAVYGVAQSRTRLKQLSSSSSN